MYIWYIYNSGGDKMGNNRGFTLVELLAVLVVLAIVIGITGYSVVNSMKNARQKTYKTTINEVEKAAVDYVLEENSAFASGYGGEFVCVRVTELVRADFLDKTVYDANVSDDETVTNSDYVFILRDKNSKTIIKKKYKASECSN